MHFEVGDVLKGYEIRQQLGLGGFGAVYLAWQQLVRREVAVKVILPDYANEPDFIRRFEAEAQLVARLEHLHIVPLYDYWRDPNGAFLIMRILKGGSLKEALNDQGPWPPDKVSSLLDQVASALAVAHRNQVIHRDMKPANILLDDDENAFLTDFGIAKKLNASDDDEDKNQIVGSPSYMAPEQIEGDLVSPQTDIYGLGIITYEMLTGLRPFDGGDLTQTLINHLTEPMPSLLDVRRDLPPGLDAVIQRATSKDAAERFPDAMAMARAFRAALGGGVTRAGTVPYVPLSSSEMRATTLINRNETLVQTDDAATMADASSSFATFLENVAQAASTQSTLDQSLDMTVPVEAVPAMADVEPDNPFKGLRPFQESDAADFFGREALVGRLVGRLSDADANARFLAVVGPSGSGKSSAVKAGLIPALREGALRGADTWFYTDMVPAGAPFENLGAALGAIATKPLPEDMRGHLASTENALPALVNELLPDDGSELVLVIDQFEEVFTQVAAEEERLLFLQCLHQSIGAPDSRLRMIVTLRADFYDRPLLYPAFGELMRQRTEIVLPLSATELERAIVGPAERVGLMVETNLVAAIVADVSEEPGALPLLQYALTEVFERRMGRTLTLRAYEDSGGVLGALARRAEELFNGLSTEQQASARQLFLRLVTPGEGAEDTRRRLRWSEMLAIDDPHDTLQRVMDLYGSYRLLTFDNDPDTREPTIEVAHEAIIRRWGRLREWIDDAREELRMQRRLQTATEEWLRQHRDESFLASGVRLQQFETLLDNATIAIGADERAFVQASIARRARLEAEEAERQAREMALERRARQRLQVLLGVFALATIIAGGLAFLALNEQRVAEVARDEAESSASTAVFERDRADQQAQISQSRELAVRALTNLEAREIDLALLLIIAAYQTDPNLDTQNSLLTSLQVSPFLERVYHGLAGRVRAVAVHPSGEQIAAAYDHQIQLWGSDHQTLGDPLRLPDVDVWSLAYSPDGAWLVAGTADGLLHRWQVSGDELTPAESIQAHDDSIYAVYFSPDSETLLSGGADGQLRVWGVASGDPRGDAIEAHMGALWSLAYQPDAQVVASGGDDNLIRLWDASAGWDALTPLGEPLMAHTNWVLALAFSPDGDLLASGSADNTILLWDWRNATPSGFALRGHEDWVRDLDFLPEGDRLLSASADNTLRLWDVVTQTPIGEPLSGHGGAVFSLARVPGQLQWISGDALGGVLGWDVTHPFRLGEPLAGHASQVWEVAYTPDGERIVSIGDGRIRIWDANSGALLNETQGPHGPISLALAPAGNRAVTGAEDGSLLFWELASDEATPLGDPIASHDQPVFAVAFAPDGARVLSGDDNGMLYLWEAGTQSRDEAITLPPGRAGIQALAFHPTDANLVAWGTRDGSL
ncbi:MAG: protein kinase domain-containing protein, partial [Anaerolineales bacterium]